MRRLARRYRWLAAAVAQVRAQQVWVLARLLRMSLQMCEEEWKVLFEALDCPFWFHTRRISFHSGSASILSQE